ncbi:MAG TPA: hypothetical protein VH092_38490 [Urbifossiella sp.]|jgi:hypothetical protein|nr:hypothetical protein [Urbifossiella sp.]
MRHLLALAATAATAGAAAAQFGTATGGVTTSGGGTSMPGQVVGSTPGLAGGTPQPIGTHQPQVGTPPGRPYDPSRPLDVFKGTGVDPNSVIAPLSPYPSLPAPEKNLIDRLYDRLDSVLTFSHTPKAVPRPPNVTPGIFRRNRERVDDRMWRRD